MGRARLFRSALAVALVATALAPLGSTAQVGPQRCADEARRTRKDGWIQLRRPAWSLGDQTVLSWASSTFVDGFLLVTNGSAVARTLDGGCTWQEVYSPAVGVGEIKLNSVNTVYGVALPPSPPGRLPYLAYAVVSDSRGARVVSSADLGESWQDEASAGLPPLSRLHSVHVAADPRVVYVLADAKSSVTSAIETTLYVTHNGGTSFTPVHRGLSPSQYTQLEIDPVDPKVVWAWDDNAIYRSGDSGLTFTKVNVPGRIGAVDVSHYPAYAPARVIVFRSDQASAHRSDDGGVTWRPMKTNGRVTGSANLYYIDALAMSSDRGVFVDANPYSIKGRNVSPRDLVLDDLAWSLGTDGALTFNLWGATPNDLFVIRLSPQFTPPPPRKLPPLKLRPANPLKQGTTTLTPENAVVRLRLGEKRRVEYELDLAPVPTPLDIFFATDSTGSMSPVIDSLRSDLQDIIDDLAKSGINVWFGVGDFKDYPGFGIPTDHPYKRFRKVGPIDDDLSRAIDAIDVGGGNGLDSALTATYQAATGEGQRIAGNAVGAGGWWVEPGNGAEWRENSLKVLVIAADVRTREPSTDPGYPGPTFKEVIDKLNFLGIEHVGLAVGTNPDQPYQSLSRVSSGTNTVAPPGGTDCDDDGKIDIAAGEPLVCLLPLSGTSKSGTNLMPAMVGLMRSLEDLQTVAFQVTGDRRVAAVSGPSIADAVNVKAHNVLTFAVEASCDRITAGERYRYDVTATVGAQTVAATGLTVECEALPAVRRPPAQREDFPPPQVRALVAAAVPPPPPPPAPITQPQVNTNPNPNPNPNPQVVTQAGMAFQDQVQLEVALAHAEMRIEDEGELLAMSSLQDQDAARAAMVLCAGMVMTAGAAVGMRRRLRSEPVRVRSSG